MPVNLYYTQKSPWISTGTSKIFFKKCWNPSETHETPVSPLRFNGGYRWTAAAASNSWRTAWQLSQRCVGVYHSPVVLPPLPSSGLEHILEVVLILQNSSRKLNMVAENWMALTHFCSLENISDKEKSTNRRLSLTGHSGTSVMPGWKVSTIRSGGW